MSFTARLMAFVKDRPFTWIPAREFEQFGRQAWRSRIADARRKFHAARDGTIQNRVRGNNILDGEAQPHLRSSRWISFGTKSSPEPSRSLPK